MCALNVPEKFFVFPTTHNQRSARSFASEQLPRTGLLARNNFRFPRHPETMAPPLELAAIADSELKRRHYLGRV